MIGFRRKLLFSIAAALLVALPAGAAEQPPLRIALLPILDSLPWYVAERQGYFAAEKVVVTVAPVASAVERDQLLQAGAVDGMLGELSAAALFNRDQSRVKVVISARQAAPGAPLFRILAAPGGGIARPADLAGVPIAISKNTIIEYVTERLLAAEGLKPDQIVGQSVPAIPERFQLLMQGKIRAAVLPDPLGQSAMKDGAVLVSDDSAHPEYAVSVLIFANSALDGNPEAIRGFLRAWSRAAAEINRDPDAWRALLLEKVRVPENVRATFTVPPFPVREVPTRRQWEDVVAWLRARGLLESDIAFGGSVTNAFLPAAPAQ